MKQRACSARQFVVTALLTLIFGACTTITRTDGTTVRIPAAGFVGSMAAANITCQDNVQALLKENATLHARIADLEAKLAQQKK